MTAVLPEPAQAPLTIPVIDAGTAGTDPLPLPGAWGPADARAALAHARDRLPLAHGPVRVVADLSTVVLRTGAHAVKVYPPGTDPDHLTVITRALAGGTTAVLPVSDPVPTPHGVVVAYPWIGHGGHPVPWPQIGALLARFHAEHIHAHVPAWVPLRRLDAQAAALPEPAGDVLRHARTVLLGELARHASPVGDGVIHGDVSEANVLPTPTGPAFIDLDFVACGPLAYDLAAAARRHRAGQIDTSDYLGFTRAYGYDVRSWDGTPVLDRLAALGGLVFRVWDDRHHGRDLAWLPAALTEWRTPL